MRLTVPFFDTSSSRTAEPVSELGVPRSLQLPAADAETAGLRILHILRAPMGGLFRHVRDLIEEQTRMGHHVGIVCDSKTGGDAARAELKRLAPWCRLGILRLRMSRSLTPGDLMTLSKIRKHVAKLQPHVVHGHGAKGGAYARLLPRVKGRVALYTPHGGALHYNWQSPCGAIFLGLERFLMRRSDGIFFESQYGARAFNEKVGRPECPNRVIPNGVSQDDFAPLPESQPTYDAVFVGELRALKGVATLIEAVAMIAKDRPFRLGIAGTGPDEKRFRALAAQHGIDKQVDFLGHKPAREMFARAKTVVVPSLAESFPYIVLEAVASGKPVIATDVGGISEIFGPHTDALLPAGNEHRLAQAIRTALDMPEFAKRRSDALRERAKKLFSTTRMAREITRFYADLRARVPVVDSVFNEPVKLPETTAV